MFDRILKEAIEAAQIADDAFEAAIKAAGFKSRWDWFLRGAPASLVAAYNAKVAADKIMHEKFAANRNQS
jgi:hypothetical protein